MAKVDAYAGVTSEKQIRNRWIIGALLGASGLTVTAISATIGILKVLGCL